MKRSALMKLIDELQHDKANGFYDKYSDMFFESLNEWADFNGYNLRLI